MKNTILVIFLALFCACGCNNRQCAVGGKDIVIARINNYTVTQSEFEREFLASPFAKKDTLESRKEFLNNLINRKLILQDAEQKGLDKDAAFLDMIQRFWEQSLLKLAIDRKSKEIANSTSVSEKTVEEVYRNMVKEGKADKPLAAMSQQIRWEITKLKEAQIIGLWMSDMRAKARIKVDYGPLDKNKQGE